MRVKELITEGTVAERREKIMQLKQALATAVKLPRYRIGIHRSIMQQQHDTYLITIPISKHDEELAVSMFERLVKREVDKLFDDWQFVRLANGRVGGVITPDGVPTFYVDITMPFVK